MTELTNVQKLAIEREKKQKELEEENKLFSYDSIQESTQFKKDIITVLHKTVAKGTTMPELAYFLQVCQSVGLSPITKEVWCYKDTLGNLLVFTGRDGFMARAQRHPEYNGFRSSEVCEKDEFSIDIMNDKITHVFSNTERGPIIGAWCKCWRKNGEPTIVWVPFKEFDKGRAVWKSNPSDMIVARAEAKCFKKTFGLTGINSEYDFNIDRNGIASPISEDVKTEDISHEEIRLEKLIEACKTKEALEKFKKDCTTPDLISVYDKKMKELTK